MNGLIGCKVGMTRIFTKDGASIPVTVIKIEEHRVVQVKNLKENECKNKIIQITTGNKKINHIKKSESGHFLQSGVKVGLGLWEFHIENNKNIVVGQVINIDFFKNIKKVDITGISKGKGFSGTIKRWNFSTQDASHGNSLSHRAPGSIGQNQTPGKVFKGKKMAGQLGNKQITIQGLEIIRVDTENKILLIKGAVPGSIGNKLIIKLAIKN